MLASSLEWPHVRLAVYVYVICTVIVCKAHGHPNARGSGGMPLDNLQSLRLNLKAF